MYLKEIIQFLYLELLPLAKKSEYKCKDGYLELKP